MGPGQHPVRRADVRHQPPARARLPEHARAALLLRWLRRLGSEVPHQGPRHLLAPLPRALHAHHAHPADAGGAGELRQAGLHDLQRGRVSRQSPHHRHGFDDERRPQPRRPRAGHPRHRVRRRDEEGRLHGRELLRAQARHSLDALLGDGGQADRALVAALRPERHRQDDALRRSEAPPDRRRRALLERRRHLQYRRRLLREGDQPHAGERAGHLPGAAIRRRARERRARRGPHRRLHRHRASRRTRAAPIRSNSSTARRSRASPAIRATSSS